MYRIHSRSYGTNERRTSACSYIHYPRFDFYPYQAGEKRSSSGSSAKRFFGQQKPRPSHEGRGCSSRFHPAFPNFCRYDCKNSAPDQITAAAVKPILSNLIAVPGCGLKAVSIPFVLEKFQPRFSSLINRNRTLMSLSLPCAVCSCMYNIIGVFPDKIKIWMVNY